MATWTQHDPVRNVDLGGPSHAIDGYDVTHIWAPHVVFHEGYWHLYFTGVDRESYEGPSLAVQRIFYARAPENADLTNPSAWQDAAFILDGDSGVLSPAITGISSPTYWAPGTGWSAACRDPFVTYDDVDHQWVMTCTIQRVQYDEAVGVATAPEPAGPWDLLGYYSSTSFGSKAESSWLVKSHATDQWALGFISGPYNAISFGAKPIGQFSDANGNDHDHIEAALLDPVGVFYPRRVAHDLMLWPFTSSQEAVYLTFNHDNGATTTRVPRSMVIYGDITSPDSYNVDASVALNARLVELGDYATVTGSSFVDSWLSDGGEYSYYVRGGSVALPSTDADGGATVTVYRNAVISDLVAFYNEPQSKLRANLFLDSSEMLTAEYQFRSVIQESETPDWTGVEFGEWVELLRNQSSVTFDNTSHDIEYDEHFHLQVRVRSTSSPGAFDDEATASCLHLTPVPAPTGAAAVLDGADVSVTWNAVEYPTLSHYKIKRVHAVEGTSYVDDIPTNTWLDVTPASGTILYYVIAVATDGRESPESNAAFVTLP